METPEKAAARILLEINAFTFSCGKPYRFASGLLSPVYCDNRLIMSFPEKWKKIVSLMVEKIGRLAQEIDVVAGVATAGIPHAALLADRLSKPMIYIRPAAKDHGKSRKIEGSYEKGQRAIIVEDHISTGGSSLRAVETARKCGLVVGTVISISTYDFREAAERFSKAGVTHLSLTSLSSILEVAREMKLLKPEEEERINEWKKEPSGWGRRMGFE